MVATAPNAMLKIVGPGSGGVVRVVVATAVVVRVVVATAVVVTVGAAVMAVVVVAVAEREAASWWWRRWRTRRARRVAVVASGGGGVDGGGVNNVRRSRRSRRKHDDAVAGGGRAGKLGVHADGRRDRWATKGLRGGSTTRRSRRCAAQTRRRRCQRWPRRETYRPPLMVDAIDGQLKVCVVGSTTRRSRRYTAQTRRRRSRGGRALKLESRADGRRDRWATKGLRGWIPQPDAVGVSRRKHDDAVASGGRAELNSAGRC